MLARATVSRPKRLDDIRACVLHGGGMLFKIIAGTEMVCAVVLRVDPLPSGPEGVIVAAAGSLPGVRLFDLITHFENRFKGVTAFRVHTARPGMVRRLLSAGYEVQETVMRKACFATA
jgi:hypothetical protein